MKRWESGRPGIVLTEDVEAKVILSPEDIADAFAEMDSSQQAKFLFRVSERFAMWGSVEDDKQTMWIAQNLTFGAAEWVQRLAKWTEEGRLEARKADVRGE
ncbi:MAG: hypothetical protein AAFQ82_05875 [Myxococcota bacterium]